jgi:alpha-D-ribose 1-methylphosphonate 5-triphosphate synthase subunit PhnL
MTQVANPVLKVRNLAKTFTLHLHGGKVLPVLDHVSFEVSSGECVVLGGPSGTGKSSILKMIYGNYAVASGEIQLYDQGRITDIATAAPAEIIKLRRHVMGYVSQFLRVIPRVPALDIVAAAARDAGAAEAAALEKPAVFWRG